MNVKSKAEQSTQTRRALERAARRLFETRGFADVSAEEIVAAAGLTRGALYHQYGGKEGLFEAVVETAMRRLRDDVARAAGTATDPVGALKLGARRFLELGAAPRTQRLLFVDAPMVMGWERWRGMDGRYGLGLLTGAIERAMAAGAMPRQPAGLAAQLLLSALIEAAMITVRSADKEAARRTAEALLDRWIDCLV